MPNRKKLLFIKLGGSSITDKATEQTVNWPVLRSLADQIAEIVVQRPDLQLVIGHGQGSFAHFPAKKYRIHEGFVHPEAVYGLAVMEDVVAKLSRIVVAELLDRKLPAVSYQPFQTVVTSDRSVATSHLHTLEEYLVKGLLPVITGDGIIDKNVGSMIWSADFSLPYYARQLRDKGWEIESLIHVTRTPGVYKDIEHPELGTYDVITPELFSSIEKSIGSSDATDVTGGMLEKVRQAVELAKDGIETVILPDTSSVLQDWTLSHRGVGTRIRVA
jgi:isopentenyl phosphate kinase